MRRGSSRFGGAGDLESGLVGRVNASTPEQNRSGSDAAKVIAKEKLTTLVDTMNKRFAFNLKKLPLYLSTIAVAFAIYFTLGLKQSTITANSPDSKNTAIVRMPAYLLSVAYAPIYFLKGHENAVVSMRVKNKSSGTIKTLFVKNLGYLDGVGWMDSQRIKWVSNREFHFIYTEETWEIADHYREFDCDINTKCSEHYVCCD